MLESLRVRLLVWYGLALALVVGAFGITVCVAFWQSLVSRADAELSQEATAVAAALRPAEGGAFDLDLPDGLNADFSGASGASYAIWTAAGQVVDASDPDRHVPQPRTPGARTRAGRREVSVSGPHGTTVLVGRSLEPERKSLRTLATTVALVGAAAFGLSVAAGWFLAGRALGPIARINSTARAMAGGDFAARIEVDHTETELSQVARALNTAFDRLNAAVELQRRFTADASHELRTPLATLLAETEWASTRRRTADEYRESLTTCRAAADRMHGLVQQLLGLARADAVDLPTARVPVPLDRVTNDVLALIRPLAESRGVVISQQIEAVIVEGDVERLRDALMNVVENAVRYNRKGGTVALAVGPEGQDAVVRVSDTGPGIAPEHLPHIFERFYRADASRPRTGGAGLGLAIARAIVERHAGTIHCASEVGRGTEFVLRLPAFPAA